tara:strand:- start:302 stop:511 length:210 start_codon:yes stop_codon:yes gene_type:complete
MSVSTADQETQSRLEHFPITLFAIGMGMMGLTLALRAAETMFDLRHNGSGAVLVLSVGILAAANNPIRC